MYLKKTNIESSGKTELNNYITIWAGQRDNRMQIQEKWFYYYTKTSKYNKIWWYGAKTPKQCKLCIAMTPYNSYTFELHCINLNYIHSPQQGIRKALE